MKFNTVEKGAERYVCGEVKPFDQKNEVFKRLMWDPECLELGKKFYYEPVHPRKKLGYRLEDLALVNAAWYMENNYGLGIGNVSKGNLYSWDWDGKYQYPRLPSGLKLEIEKPKQASKLVKRAALHFGAALAGVADLDRRWIYSRGYRMAELKGGTSYSFEIPEDFKYVIVVAIEMDYDAIACSPEGPSGAATGQGYSMMAYVAGTLTNFIRGLGYKAIPSGNDTACSIPLAIDAGLGELGRHGLLITPEYGSRVRLAKVYTDLPLQADEPIEFGAWEFCKICKKCAKFCPSQALMYDDPIDHPFDISNREGLMRWQVNAKKCIAHWVRNNCLDCSNCIRVCPFNKPKGWLHDAARWIILKTRKFDKTLLFFDDLLRYGKRKKSSKFWSNS